MVVFESTKARAVFDMEESQPVVVVEAFYRWLLSAMASVKTSGVCKSFGIGIHLNDADCDHETAGVKLG